jgi:hypothetical protein
MRDAEDYQGQSRRNAKRRTTSCHLRQHACDSPLRSHTVHLSSSLARNEVRGDRERLLLLDRVYGPLIPLT